MDNCWERSLPFVELDRDTVSRLVHRCDPGLTVETITPVREGCRASTYCIRVEGGTRFLLKWFAAHDESWECEHQLFSLLQGDVPMPRLYFAGNDEILHGSFALYEFVRGMSLRDALHSGVRPGEEFIECIGRIAATIHRHTYSTVGFLDADLNVKQQLPPVTEWYSLFLGPRARARLGSELTAAIREIVEAGRSELEALDRCPALVHGDFRPTNIMVDNQRLTGIVDWEFAMAGHPLSDVAQFFRYGEDFGERERRTFERGYRSIPGMQLPPEWERTGKLRDLANLLQMIDAEGERPLKDEDLKHLIESTLSS
jgi:aminoglycoside phosphotransferase (APT) family kinase protein